MLCGVTPTVGSNPTATAKQTAVRACPWRLFALLDVAGAGASGLRAVASATIPVAIATSKKFPRFMFI
mgnify:CR=1 FL=1